MTEFLSYSYFQKKKKKNDIQSAQSAVEHWKLLRQWDKKHKNKPGFLPRAP